MGNSVKVLAVMLCDSTIPEDTAFGSVISGSIKLGGLLCCIDFQRSVWEDWYYTAMILLRNEWVDIPGS